jgi:hypothetical protein
VCDRGDPGEPMEHDPDVPLFVQARLTGVQPHPDTALGSVRPVMRRKRALDLDRGLDRTAGAVERHAEAVADRVDLSALVDRNGLS